MSTKRQVTLRWQRHESPSTSNVEKVVRRIEYGDQTAIVVLCQTDVTGLMRQLEHHLQRRAASSGLRGVTAMEEYVHQRLAVRRVVAQPFSCPACTSDSTLPVGACSGDRRSCSSAA